MAFEINPKFVWAGLAGVILAVVLLLGAAFGILILQDRQAAHYPGAIQLSAHDQVSVYPQASYKQVASYRTMDDFVSVYDWYSRGFSLGPEKQAQSQCIHMYDSQTEYSMSRIVSVTVCDTPNGRMIFVQRTVEIEGR
ncbi:MAG TPA: hypothetical protein VI451_14810 [Anaerolineales bacterium]|nr:hypothetical protein [Anaerolineales bacterium]